MIYDTLEHLATYRGISPLLDQAIAFLQTHQPLDALTDGRLDIEGDLVYGNVMAVACKQSGLVWESHQRYADLQISLTGGETIAYLPITALDRWGAYEKDTRFSESTASGIPLEMQKGTFAVFFPWDAHRPCQGDGPGRKLVLKIAWKEETT